MKLPFPTRESDLTSRSRRVSMQRHEGVALVITMILLAVITTLAIAFLALTHRETGAVDAMQRTTDAELATQSGLERAKAEIVAPFIQRNWLSNGVEIMGPDFLVSVAQQTNRLSGLGNLRIDATPPVFVDTNRPSDNGPADDRFYLDLNRNRLFEDTGYVPVTSDAPGPKPGTFQFLLDGRGDILTNWLVGDPQWVGLLNDPTSPHGPTNRFIGRYAFVILPIGRSLDINWIHNDVRQPRDPAAGQYGYSRSQGVGSFELNLAGFLCDLNTNAWNNPLPPYNAVPYNYVTNQVVPPYDAGTAFDDAWQILRYRYNGSKANLNSMDDMFEQNVQNVVGFDLIDGYADGISSAANVPDNDVSRLPWAGAKSRRNFFSAHDFLTKVPGTPPGGFSNHLFQASLRGNSYDRYTFYRLLSQMSTDSEAEEDGKIDLNYMNIHSWAPGLANDPTAVLRVTDLIPWSTIDPEVRVMRNGVARRIDMGRPGPELFFLSAVTNVLARQPETAFMVTNRLRGANPLRIPIRLNGSTVVTNGTDVDPLYSGRLNQLLKLVANIYDAAAPRDPTDLFPMPVVFRPRFAVEGSDVYIVDYVLVNEPGSRFFFSHPWRDLSLGETPAADDCVYGIPFVAGARKGYPNFNEFASRTTVQAVRRLHVTKPLGDTNLDRATYRQFLTLQVTNEFQLEAWNSYSASTNPRPLRLYYSNQVAMRITNSQAPLVNLRSFTFTNFMPAVYAPGAWKSNTYLVTPMPSTRMLYWTNLAITDPGGDTNLWGISATNHVLFFLVDDTDRLVDAVGLSLPNGRFDLGAEMATPLADATTASVQGLWDRTKHTRNPWSKQLQNHLDISRYDTASVSTKQDWDNYALDVPSRSGAIQAFNDFIRDPTRTDGDSGFVAVREIVQTNFFRVSDPFVHFTLEDLHVSSAYITLPRTKLMQRFELGGPNANPETRFWNNGDTDQPNATPGVGTVNPALRDPGIRSTDNWNFPSGPFPTLGWLGRVHRATPWQSVYFKSELSGSISDQIWQRHTGPLRNFKNANQMRPKRDWELLDVFTVTLHPNATRGRLSINQTNLAAWSAALTSILTSGAANDGRVVVTQELIWPAAQAPQLPAIVDGINSYRTNLPNGQFHRFSDFLRVPELTYHSPYLNRIGFIPEQPNGTERVTDSDYERIPEQILSLVKLGEPRFVIYAWGQSLKPARNGVVKNGDNVDFTGPSILTADDLGPNGRGERGTCMNYQITGEMATRTVVRLKFDPNPNFDLRTNAFEFNYARPHVVVESFNILPNE